MDTKLLAEQQQLHYEMNEKPHLEFMRLLLARLERISADSYWAHRASGVRGSLLKAVETLENGEPVQRGRLERLIASGYKILEGAVREQRGWKETRE